ncbi:MAG: hypothetical protein EPN84_13555 [Legionella sp.]|nr:MAG: hypothetical protein EPN84_13555 [Legionella sp.]
MQDSSAEILAEWNDFALRTFEEGIAPNILTFRDIKELQYFLIAQSKLHGKQERKNALDQMDAELALEENGNQKLHERKKNRAEEVGIRTRLLKRIRELKRDLDA